MPNKATKPSHHEKSGCVPAMANAKRAGKILCGSAMCRALLIQNPILFIVFIV